MASDGCQRGEGWAATGSAEERRHREEARNLGSGRDLLARIT